MITHTPTCRRELMRQSDDSAAYLKETCSCTVFVFGANLAGRHGAGSAREAVKHFGAIYGQGEGRQGQSYAIPTKGPTLRPLTLAQVAFHIGKFLGYAEAHPDERFVTVKVGCGLAGFKEHEIAPWFRRAPKNVVLPEGWTRDE